MESLIFGRTWQEIQDMQQKKYIAKTVSGNISKPMATVDDIKLLKDRGLDWLKQQQFYGVIDRLNNSGLLTESE